MKNQRKAWLAAGLLALVAAACFSDPTSDLRSGPTAITVNFAAVSVAAGDSVTLIGIVRDNQGNPLPVGTVSWTSADPSVAVANEDVLAKAPGDIFTRAYVRGVSNQAGVTTVTVTAQGVTNTVRVTVLPKTFPGTATVTGTAGADTITVQRPAPLAPLVVTFSAGDTLVLTATPTVTFSATSSTVSFGALSGMIVSRTAAVIKVLARAPYAGKATVTNLTYAGDANTGPIDIASLETDSITIQHARFRGTAAVTADPNFGANTLFTVTAAAGMTFDASSSVALGGTPPVGIVAAVPATGVIILSRTGTTMTGISPATLTGVHYVVRGALLGTSRIDSLRTGTAGLAVTVNQSAFPGTITTANGTGDLLDTVYVNAGGGATFTAASSVVTIGGVPTLIVGTRTTTLLKVLAGRGASGQVSITNVVVAGTTIPSLSSAGTTTVSGTVTGEAGEPANDTPGGVTITLGTAAAPYIRYGAVDDGVDIDDFFTFTLAAATNVTLSVGMVGTGGGGSSNPDIDLYMCNTACNALVGGTGGGTAANPENLAVTALAAGTYHIIVEAYDTGGILGTYRLTARGP